ncbi:hypothetical protein NC651_025057 [Populus alba x Populus x berolinensis]|nr:hypothetical protein NC651_025057 [Populus alba x Populus x berolinensis]
MALPIKTVAASMAPVFSSEKMGRNHGNKNTASKRERKVGGAYAHAEEGAWKKRCSSKGLSSMATTNQLGGATREAVAGSSEELGGLHRQHILLMTV